MHQIKLVKYWAKVHMFFLCITLWQCLRWSLKKWGPFDGGGFSASCKPPRKIDSISNKVAAYQ